MRRTTLAEFVNSTEADRKAIGHVVKHGIKPNKILRFKRRRIAPKTEDLWQLAWGEVITVRDSFSKGKPEQAIELLYAIDDKILMGLEVFNFFAVQRWIMAQLEQMARIESEELSGEPCEAEKAAGVEQLQRFEHALSLDALANGDLLKYDALLRLPYVSIFRQLCLNHTRRIIEKKYLEHVSRKAQRPY